jgi:predicted metal-binding protein
MNQITRRAETIVSDIANQALRLALYKQVAPLFEEVNFPDDVYVYIWKNWEGVIKIEFSPDSQNKDFQPLVHSLVQKLEIRFERETVEDTVNYRAEFTRNGQKYAVLVTGVVPGSCQLIETLEQKTDEELEAERAEALSRIETTRVVRKIVCLEHEINEA